MTQEKRTKIPETKIKAVKELAGEIKKSNTLMIVSIKGLPSKEFQDIKKSLRDTAKIKVAKKNILVRSIKAFGNESILPLEKNVKENCAFMISDTDGFELAGLLVNKKIPTFAKAGQISPVEIEVKKGPTELVPGPAISELGAVGLQISIENGKISIRDNKILVREGQEINSKVASILQKLNIKPLTIGLEPLAVYDVKSGKIYTEIKIDSEGARVELVTTASKSLGFAQRISYACKETIGYLLAKGNAHANAINKKIESSGGGQ